MPDTFVVKIANLCLYKSLEDIQTLNFSNKNVIYWPYLHAKTRDMEIDILQIVYQQTPNQFIPIVLLTCCVL